MKLPKVTKFRELTAEEKAQNQALLQEEKRNKEATEKAAENAPIEAYTRATKVSQWEEMGKQMEAAKLYKPREDNTSGKVDGV